MNYTLIRGSPYQFDGYRVLLSKANWHLLSPSWPLHDLVPSSALHSGQGVLPTKFCGHRALLSKLISTWLQLTPTWPLTSAMHFALVKDSSHHIWWSYGISKQFDPCLIPDDPCMSFARSSALLFGQGFFIPNLEAMGHF